MYSTSDADRRDILVRNIRGGNPFKIGRDGTREQVLDKYEDYLAARPELKERIAREFCGKDLACWCDLDERCHADILLRIANPHP
jgi:hypothetical protein